MFCIQLRPWFQLRNLAKEAEIGTKNRKVFNGIEKTLPGIVEALNSLERNELEQNMESKGVNGWLDWASLL